MDRVQRRQKRALEIMRIVINETSKVLYVVKQVMEAQKTQLEQQILLERQMLLEQQMLHEQQKLLGQQILLERQMLLEQQKLLGQQILLERQMLLEQQMLVLILLQKLHHTIENFLGKAMSELRDYMKEFQVVKQVLNTIQTIPPPIEKTDIQMQHNLREVQEQIQIRLRQCVTQLPEIVLPEVVLLVEQEEKKKIIDPFLNDVQSLHTQMQTEMQKMQKKLEEKQKELEKEQEKIEQKVSQTHTKHINEYIQWIQEQIKMVQRQAKMAERRQWDEYYMKIACLAAQRSKDPSTPVS